MATQRGTKLHWAKNDTAYCVKNTLYEEIQQTAILLLDVCLYACSQNREKQPSVLSFASLRLSVYRFSVRIEPIRSHWTDIHEIWHLNIFWNSVEKIKFSLNSNKHNVYFTWRPCTFPIITRSVLFIMRNISYKICWENQNTQCSINFSRKSRRLRDNVDKYGRSRQATDDTIIRRICIACWINKPTCTIKLCNTYCFSTTAVVMRTCCSVN